MEEQQPQWIDDLFQAINKQKGIIDDLNAKKIETIKPVVPNPSQKIESKTQATSPDLNSEDVESLKQLPLEQEKVLNSIKEENLKKENKEVKDTENFKDFAFEKEITENELTKNTLSDIKNVVLEPKKDLDVLNAKKSENKIEDNIKESPPSIPTITEAEKEFIPSSTKVESAASTEQDVSLKIEKPAVTNINVTEVSSLKNFSEPALQPQQDKINSSVIAENIKVPETVEEPQKPAPAETVEEPQKPAPETPTQISKSLQINIKDKSTTEKQQTEGPLAAKIPELKVEDRVTIDQTVPTVTEKNIQPEIAQEQPPVTPVMPPIEETPENIKQEIPEFAAKKTPPTPQGEENITFNKITGGQQEKENIKFDKQEELLSTISNSITQMNLAITKNNQQLQTSITNLISITTQILQTLPSLRGGTTAPGTATIEDQGSNTEMSSYIEDYRSSFRGFNAPRSELARMSPPNTPGFFI